MTLFNESNIDSNVNGINYAFLLEQLKRHEGLRLKVYKCPAGRLTIGYGRNVEDRGITKKEAEYLLNNDVEDCEKELKISFTWYNNLDHVRQSVLINMCFNMGIRKLKQFKKMIHYIESKEWDKAADEMKDSNWFNQVGDRAVELITQMRSGVFQNTV